MQASLLPTARRFNRQLRFGLVGISGVIINSIILWALVHGLRLAVPLASMIATEVAIGSNFLLNDRWTFAAHTVERSLVQRFARFNGVALGGMAITTLVLTVLTHYAQLNLLIANALAVGTATIWNYIANSRWTWSSSPRLSPAARQAPPADCLAPTDRDDDLVTYWYLLNDRDEVAL